MEQVKASVHGNNGVGSRRSTARPTLNLTALATSVRAAWRAVSGETNMEGSLDDLIRRATEAATQISDSQFLSQLEQDLQRHAQRAPQFQVLADKAKHRAFEYLDFTIMRTVKKLAPAAHKTQEEECTERIKRESTKRADQELDRLRLNLIKNVNSLSTRTISSCVSSSLLIVIRD